MSAFSGISVALAGAFAGQWLRNKNIMPSEKGVGLIIAGAVIVLIAIACSKFLPFIKNIWSGSFVLLTAGLSSILLGIFYLVIDVLEWKKWSFVFTVIGIIQNYLYWF
jgi:predicted acyltransferase